MTVYFTSDPHWGHGFVAHLRGFNGDTNAHDLQLLENFQAVTKVNDQVWWLGDLAMGRPEYALSMIDQIPGEHHLICGNHDPVSPIFRDSHKWQRQYLEVFKSVQAYGRRRIPRPDGEGHYEALMSHYPYSGYEGSDHTEMERYTQWRLPDHGQWLLHGHTHNQTQRVHDGRQLHVGLDAWDMKPVSLDQVSQIVIATEADIANARRRTA